METLFSFELLVDYIRVENVNVSDELAVALRLLDFPTLIIYQPEHRQVRENELYTFNRGKACFFKMNVDSLHSHLSNTPLYVMVLDVKEEIPKFVGSSIISLAKVMDRIRQDVTGRGVSTPSSHGQRGLVGVSNLTEEKVGTISLSYKLLSLGSSLMPHIKDKEDPQNTEEQCLKEHINKKYANVLTVDSEKAHSTSDQDGVNRLPKTEVSSEEETLLPKSQVTDNIYEEDMSAFCPPHLYYNNSAEERRQNEERNRRPLKLDMDFTFENSGDETDENTHLSVKDHRYNAITSSRDKPQVSSEVTTNVIGEALRQMPLLNALLVELSQLNVPTPNQSLSVHPNLAWIYRPASTEPPTVQRGTAQEAKNGSLVKNKIVSSPKIKDLHFPRHSSTPTQDQKGSLRKKLVYGTTKTFNLRLKQNTPAVVKQRECVELIQSKTSLKAKKEKLKSSKRLIKSPKRKSTQSSNLSENIETMIQSITVESTPRESFTEKHELEDEDKSKGMLHKDRTSPKVSEKPLLIESPSRLIHILANVESDSAHNKSEINQSQPDRHSGKCSGSSSSSSSDSSLSVLSREINQETDYADDFNSFEPSDAFSPDPMSSPEPHRAKTPNSPSGPDLCRSDSSSESVQKRAVLPVPVKASRSPQRALRGTHTIQRQTQASGLSFSSDDGERDGSLPTVHSRKGLTESSREERSSGAESFRSSEDCRSESNRNRRSMRGISDEFSFEHKAEEEDELGSLDFRKGYQHISELVAQKLPGYTM